MAVFNAQDYPEEKPESFVVPKGLYELYFSEKEMKFSNNGTQYVKCKVTMNEGPRKGKYFFHNFFVWNSDPAKEKKARSWLGNFFRAVGIESFDIDVEEEWNVILGKPFKGDVDIDTQPGYDPKNVLLPWGFHSLTPKSVLEQSSAGVPPQPAKKDKSFNPSDPKAYEDDIPF